MTGRGADRPAGQQHPGEIPGAGRLRLGRTDLIAAVPVHMLIQPGPSPSRSVSHGSPALPARVWRPAEACLRDAVVPGRALTLNFEHTRLTHRFRGRDSRLTDVAGNIVQQLPT